MGEYADSDNEYPSEQASPQSFPILNDSETPARNSRSPEETSSGSSDSSSHGESFQDAASRSSENGHKKEEAYTNDGDYENTDLHVNNHPNGHTRNADYEDSADESHDEEPYEAAPYSRGSQGSYDQDAYDGQLHGQHASDDDSHLLPNISSGSDRSPVSNGEYTRSPSSSNSLSPRSSPSPPPSPSLLSHEDIPARSVTPASAPQAALSTIQRSLSPANHTSSSAALNQSVILSKIPRYAVLTVTQPQKVSDGSSSYISYLVTAQQFPGEKPERSRRRFSDFAKLYDNLSAEFPACAIPPLPDRWRIEYIAGDRFAPEFTAKRAASSQRFLFRVSQHPSSRRSRNFMAFLSAQGMGKAASSSSSGSAMPGSQNGGPGKSAMNGASDIRSAAGGNGSDSAALSTALDHIGEALMNAFSKAKNQSKEMTDAKERAGRYEQNIATLDKAVVRASKTQSELAFDFENMCKQAHKSAKLEPKSSHEFEKLADTAESLSKATQQLRVGVDSHFACASRDMSHYVQASKGMLKQREQRQIDYEALIDYLKRSEHELVAAEHGQTAPAFSSSFLKSKMNESRGVDKEQARQQRIAKLKGRINVFKDESQRAKQISDDYEELAKREVRVFDQTEAIESQQSLSGLSDSYINFYQSVLSDLRELEASLD